MSASLLAPAGSSGSGPRSGASSPIDSSPHEPLSAVTTSSASASLPNLAALQQGLASCANGSGHPNVFVRCGERGAGHPSTTGQGFWWSRRRRRLNAPEPMATLPSPPPQPTGAGACRYSGARARSPQCLGSLECSRACGWCGTPSPSTAWGELPLWADLGRWLARPAAAGRSHRHCRRVRE